LTVEDAMLAPGSDQLLHRPLISVVVASFNYADYIGDTLKSILAQTEGNFEIIVIDDASTDRSRDVVKSFSDRRISMYVNDENLGSSRTYNRGAALAAGRYITYLDADDWIEPRKFELQIEHFGRNASTDILGTYVTFRGADGMRHPKAGEYEKNVNQPHDFNGIDRWARGNRLIASSVMLRRTVHERIGVRDPAMISADFELWTRAMGAGLRFELLPVPLLNYRLHDRSATQKRPPKDRLVEHMYIFCKNLLPKITTPAAFRLSLKRIVDNSQFAQMEESERYWHLAFLLMRRCDLDFAAFKRALLTGPRDDKLLSEGKYWFQMLHLSQASERAEIDRRIERYLSNTD
jgi:glycosyltransferase involved in cell wall biosynthesis